MYKKIFLVSLLAIFLLQVLYMPLIKAEDKIKILCSFLPVYIYTLNIVGEQKNVEVKLMVSSLQGCVHKHSLTTADMKMILTADVIVINGLGVEHFLEAEAVKNIKAKFINISTGIKCDNAHIWASPSKAVLQVRNLVNALSQIDAVNSDVYKNNADSYILKLQSLDVNFKNLVKKAKNKKVILSSPELEVFAKDIGLDVLGYIEEDHLINPSAKKINELIKIARAEKAVAILVEKQDSQRLARVVSENTNVPICIIDSLISGDLNKDEYEKVMLKNYEALKKCLNN